MKTAKPGRKSESLRYKEGPLGRVLTGVEKKLNWRLEREPTAHPYVKYASGWQDNDSK
jgi:hypothetical protein